MLGKIFEGRSPPLKQLSSVVFDDPPLGYIPCPMKKVSTQTLFRPERLRIVFFVTWLFFLMRSPFDVFKLVPAHHAIPGVVAIGPYAALYPSARMLQMGTIARPPPSLTLARMSA